MERKNKDAVIGQLEKAIVFVDDDKVQHMINKRTLLKICPNLKLFFFEDPYLALEWLGNNQVDILLLDINMPEMDGWHFLKLMTQKGIDIDVRMLTSSLDPDDLDKSREYAMVKGFLVKPLRYENIMEFLGN